jgi:PAS domain-containing protein
VVALNPPVCEFGRPAIDFDLPGTDGRRYTLADCRGPNGLLVMFICNHCPYVRAIIDRLIRDCRELAGLGIGCVAIMSNDVAAYPEDAPDNMRRWANELGFLFPYLMTRTRPSPGLTARSARPTSSATTPGSNCNIAVDSMRRAEIRPRPTPGANCSKPCATSPAMDAARRPDGIDRLLDQVEGRKCLNPARLGAPGRTGFGYHWIPLSSPQPILDHADALTTDAETRRRHAYLRAVMASMPQGISVFDENLRLRVWNRGFLEVLELPESAVYHGVPFADLIRIPAERGEYGPGDPEEHVRRITELARQFQPHRFERTRPNGRTHLTQGEPLHIDGQLAGFITTYTDITDRKAAEEGLRTQYDLLQTVVESIPSGISLFDKNLNLTLHNRELLRLLDFPPSLFARGQVRLEDLFRFNAERGEYGPGDPESIVQTRWPASASRSPTISSAPARTAARWTSAAYRWPTAVS